MRKYIGKYILLFIICLAIGISVFCFVSAENKRSEGQRVTLMNRVANLVYSRDEKLIEITLTELCGHIIPGWADQYGRDNIPSDIRFIKADNVDGPYSQLGNGDSIWSLDRKSVV